MRIYENRYGVRRRVFVPRLWDVWHDVDGPLFFNKNKITTRVEKPLLAVKPVNQVTDIGIIEQSRGGAAERRKPACIPRLWDHWCEDAARVGSQSTSSGAQVNTSKSSGNTPETRPVPKPTEKSLSTRCALGGLYQNEVKQLREQGLKLAKSYSDIQQRPVKSAKPASERPSSHYAQRSTVQNLTRAAWQRSSTKHQTRRPPSGCIGVRRINSSSGGTQRGVKTLRRLDTTDIDRPAYDHRRYQSSC